MEFSRYFYFGLDIADLFLLIGMTFFRITNGKEVAPTARPAATAARNETTSTHFTKPNSIRGRRVK
jgi:hypothetical protein